MICEACNGTGLASQLQVCTACHGLGHDGSIAPEEAVVVPPVEEVKKEVKTRVRKVVSAVKKAVKRK